MKTIVLLCFNLMLTSFVGCQQRQLYQDRFYVYDKSEPKYENPNYNRVITIEPDPVGYSQYPEPMVNRFVGANTDSFIQKPMDSQDLLIQKPTENYYSNLAPELREEVKLERLMESPLYAQYHKYKAALKRKQMLEKQQAKYVDEPERGLPLVQYSLPKKSLAEIQQPSHLVEQEMKANSAHQTGRGFYFPAKRPHKKMIYPSPRFSVDDLMHIHETPDIEQHNSKKDANDEDFALKPTHVAILGNPRPHTPLKEETSKKSENNKINGESKAVENTTKAIGEHNKSSTDDEKTDESASLKVKTDEGAPNIKIVEITNDKNDKKKESLIHHQIVANTVSAKNTSEDHEFNLTNKDEYEPLFGEERTKNATTPEEQKFAAEEESFAAKEAKLAMKETPSLTKVSNENDNELQSETRKQTAEDKLELKGFSNTNDNSNEQSAGNESNEVTKDSDKFSKEVPKETNESTKETPNKTFDSTKENKSESNESTKETPKESNNSSNESSKEFSSESKDSAKEAPKESNESKKETPKDSNASTNESSKEISKDSNDLSKETAKESKELSKESKESNNSTNESAKEFSKESNNLPNESSKELSNELNESPKKTPKESSESPNENPKESNEVNKNSSKEFSKESNDLSNESSESTKENSNESTKESAKELSKKLNESTKVDDSSEPSKEIPKESKDSSKESSKGFSNDSPKETSNENSFKQSNDQTKETSDSTKELNELKNEPAKESSKETLEQSSGLTKDSSRTTASEFQRENPSKEKTNEFKESKATQEKTEGPDGYTKDLGMDHQEQNKTNENDEKNESQKQEDANGFNAANPSNTTAGVGQENNSNGGNPPENIVDDQRHFDKDDQINQQDEGRQQVETLEGNNNVGENPPKVIKSGNVVSEEEEERQGNMYKPLEHPKNASNSLVQDKEDVGITEEENNMRAMNVDVSPLNRTGRTKATISSYIDEEAKKTNSNLNNATNDEMETSQSSKPVTDEDDALIRTDTSLAPAREEIKSLDDTGKRHEQEENVYKGILTNKESNENSKPTKQTSPETNDQKGQQAKGEKDQANRVNDNTSESQEEQNQTKSVENGYNKGFIMPVAENIQTKGFYVRQKNAKNKTSVSNNEGQAIASTGEKVTESQSETEENGSMVPDSNGKINAKGFQFPDQQPVEETSKGANLTDSSVNDEQSYAIFKQAPEPQKSLPSTGFRMKGKGFRMPIMKNNNTAPVLAASKEQDDTHKGFIVPNKKQNESADMSRGKTGILQAKNEEANSRDTTNNTTETTNQQHVETRPKGSGFKIPSVKGTNKEESAEARSQKDDEASTVTNKTLSNESNSNGKNDSSSTTTSSDDKDQSVSPGNDKLNGFVFPSSVVSGRFGMPMPLAPAASYFPYANPYTAVSYPQQENVPFWGGSNMWLQPTSYYPNFQEQAVAKTGVSRLSNGHALVAMEEPAVELERDNTGHVEGEIVPTQEEVATVEANTPKGLTNSNGEADKASENRSIENAQSSDSGNETMIDIVEDKPVNATATEENIADELEAEGKEAEKKFSEERKLVDMEETSDMENSTVVNSSQDDNQHNEIGKESLVDDSKKNNDDENKEVSGHKTKGDVPISEEEGESKTESTQQSMESSTQQDNSTDHKNTDVSHFQGEDVAKETENKPESNEKHEMLMQSIVGENEKASHQQDEDGGYTVEQTTEAEAIKKSSSLNTIQRISALTEWLKRASNLLKKENISLKRKKKSKIELRKKEAGKGVHQTKRSKALVRNNGKGTSNQTQLKKHQALGKNNEKTTRQVEHQKVNSKMKRDNKHIEKTARKYAKIMKHFFNKKSK